MSTVLITGNTYPVKDQIKALGGRWNAESKGWNVPAEKADEARRLVAGATKSSPRRSNYDPNRFNGSDDPDGLLGTEWAAEELRNGSGLALVWRPIGEARTCTVCRWFGKWFFGISVRGNIKG